MGEITAVTPRQALQKALEDETFDPDKVWVWWIIPDSAITRSETDETTIASMFAPAKEKKYRQQTYYGFVSPTRKKRGKKKK